MKKRLLWLILIPLVFGALKSYSATNTPAKDVSADTTNFNGNLSSTDTTVQKALETLDNVISSVGNVNWEDIGGLISNNAQLQGALDAKQNTINWAALNKVIQAGGINWASLNKDVKASGINWLSLGQDIQRAGINWTSLNMDIQRAGVNWSDLNKDIQRAGINWLLIKDIQTAGINWASVKNQEMQRVGINWTDLNKDIQSSGINWLSLSGDINLTSAVTGVLPVANGGNPWTVSGSDVTRTTGNVGIGTPNPGTRFEVNGTGGNMRLTNLGAFYFGNTQDTFLVATAASAGGIAMYTDLNIKKFETLTGATNSAQFTQNVGIGTPTPKQRLDVVGNGLFSGTVTASNVTGSNSGDVTLSGQNYLSLTGQALTANQIQRGNINWTLVKDIQSAGINWNSLNQDVQMKGINWTDLPVSSIGASSGQLWIGKSNGGMSLNTLAPGAGISITNSSGGITIAATGGGAAAPGGSVPQLQYAASGSNLGGVAGSGADSNGNIGIGTPLPASKLTVNGGEAIGAAYVQTTAPTNGLIVQGNVGIGTPVAGSAVRVVGTVAATAVTGDGSGLTNMTSSQVGLGSVENTTLSTWPGSSNVTTVGTVSSGTWAGSTIAVNKGGTGATTLTGLVVGNGASSMSTVTAPTGAVVGTTDTQTLSAKTLTAPFIAQIIGGATASSSLILQSTSGVGTGDFIRFLTGSGAEAMRITTTGAVTIGTTTPVGSAKVTVAGTLNASFLTGDGSGITNLTTPGISGLTTNYITKALNANAVTNGMMFDTGGGVGLGTTSAINGRLVVFGGNVGIGTSTPRAPVDVAGVTASTSFQVTGTSTDPLVMTSPNGVGMGTTAVAPQLFVMPSNGNTGIGTWVPTSKLQVIGNIDATSYTGNGSGLTGVAAANGWALAGSNIYTSTLTNHVGIGTTNANAATVEIVKQTSTAPLKVSSGPTGNGDYLLINSAGNVGIGTTLADAKFKVNASGGNIVMGATGGNVGIGTTSVDAKLTVTGSGGNVTMATTGGNVGIGTSNPLGGLVIMNGNVGIGTWSPTAPLEINGAFRISIGTTTPGTITCCKSISNGKCTIGYCTGTLTNSICGTCN